MSLYFNFLITMIYTFLDIVYYLDYSQWHRLCWYVMDKTCGHFCYFILLCYYVGFNYNKTSEKKRVSFFNIITLMSCAIILKIKAYITYLIDFFKVSSLNIKATNKWSTHLKTNPFKLKRKNYTEQIWGNITRKMFY